MLIPLNVGTGLGGFGLPRTYGGVYTKGSNDPRPSKDFSQETIIKNVLMEMQTCCELCLIPHSVKLPLWDTVRKRKANIKMHSGMRMTVATSAVIMQ